MIRWKSVTLKLLYEIETLSFSVFFIAFFKHLNIYFRSLLAAEREVAGAVTAVSYSSLTSLYFPPAITCGHRRSIWGIWAPTAAIKPFLMSELWLWPSVHSECLLNVLSHFSSFHHNWKEGRMGRIFLFRRQMRAFVPGLVTPSGTEGHTRTCLSDALSDQAHPLHYGSGSNQLHVLILPCLTGNWLPMAGGSLKKEEKMDEAVMQGKVEKCAQCSFAWISLQISTKEQLRMRIIE